MLAVGGLATTCLSQLGGPTRRIGSIASEVGVPSVAGEVISYPVSVHGTQVHSIDQAALIGQIKGLSLGGATGSVLSLFPPENATGNYVKVVQRVPVRIDFTDLANEDPNHQLRPGLSVEPKVRVKQ